MIVHQRAAYTTIVTVICVALRQAGKMRRLKPIIGNWSEDDYNKRPDKCPKSPQDSKYLVLLSIPDGGVMGHNPTSKFDEHKPRYFHIFKLFYFSNFEKTSNFFHSETLRLIQSVCVVGPILLRSFVFWVYKI